MIQQLPNYSDSYVFGLEGLFENFVKEKYPEAFILFVEQENSLILEITVRDKKIYDRQTSIASKRRCIENFFGDMVYKTL